MNLPLNIDIQQIFLHMLNFVLLFAIFYLLLYKPVKKFMDERAAYYKEMDDNAQKNLEDAEKSKAEYQSKLEKFGEEMDKKAEIAHRQTEQLSDRMVKQAQEDADRIIANAKQEAKRERDKIINSASDEISDMVTVAAAKILYKDTNEAFESFLDSAEGSGKDAE